MRHYYIGVARSHEVVANWEMLDEQSRFEVFARALLRLCDDNEDEARTLWTELESLRSRTGGLYGSWQPQLQHA